MSWRPLQCAGTNKGNVMQKLEDHNCCLMFEVEWEVCQRMPMASALPIGSQLLHDIHCIILANGTCGCMWTVPCPVRH